MANERSDKKSRRRRRGGFVDVINGLLMLVVLGMLALVGLFLYGANQFYQAGAVTADTSFTVAGEAFAIPAGETIHTENSYKYGLRDARFLLRAAQWQPIAEWADCHGQFMTILAAAGAASHMP